MLPKAHLEESSLTKLGNVHDTVQAQHSYIATQHNRSYLRLHLVDDCLKNIDIQILTLQEYGKPLCFLSVHISPRTIGFNSVLFRTGVTYAIHVRDWDPKTGLFHFGQYG